MLPARPLSQAPAELVDAVREFWPDDQVEAAVSIADLESGWNAFALLDTASAVGGCGRPLPPLRGVPITSERSVGWFQINACNFPDWEWQRLYNTRHNCGTAHMLWQARGWQPWFFSAKTLGLL